MAMKAVKEEYVQLQLAEELDDVDVSLSTLLYRSRRIAEIRDTYNTSEWDIEVERTLKDANTRYCSGAKYHQR